ncbi:unnamed protein product [Moneuplotes crassus]|uniref:Uncharacterized protein n=1 Tax=Euplotes crassus TaxID=5936 RepID=A0AAD2D3B2_EUPCR|nr:unnamed protein product [Moneuplotes crassus]CAI2380194.1 unnamed protein product [Moneuplotes crassus]|mmetsp:Transcript_17969/g.17702  ORF Transcript_17969/g.17702 Transcript_17969/m.17702 type:complete len:85 (-) Transcript_17969:54-308(-)
MTKGTQSFGKKNNHSHTYNRHTGKTNLHKHKIDYDAKKKTWNYTKKAKRRVAPGTGRRRHLKLVHRRAKNGFRDGQRRAIKTRN